MQSRWAGQGGAETSPCDGVHYSSTSWICCPCCSTSPALLPTAGLSVCPLLCSLSLQLHAPAQAAKEREERQHEAERRAESERRAAEKRQRTAAQADAAANYRALLTEVVREPDASWRDFWPRLERDAQVGGDEGDEQHAQWLPTGQACRFSSPAPASLLTSVAPCIRCVLGPAGPRHQPRPGPGVC